MPQPMPLHSNFLCTMRIRVSESYIINDVPKGKRRRIDIFSGGEVDGPLLKGKILPGGSDELLTRNDSSLTPNVRLVIKTDDNALILVNYKGVRHGPAEVMDRIANGMEVHPTEYYLRNAPFFETSSGKYDWLNRIVSVGVGRRETDSAVYDVHEIL
jgi:hypothetical protein